MNAHYSLTSCLVYFFPFCTRQLKIQKGIEITVGSKYTLTSAKLAYPKQKH